MVVEHDELRELRGDLIDYMRERFDGLDRRIQTIGECANDHETRISVIEDRFTAGSESKPLLRNPKTYAVGGIGTAFGMIVLEFVKYWGANAPK